MKLPFHTLDAGLFDRAQALLDEEWLDRDADLAPIVPTGEAWVAWTRILLQAAQTGRWPERLDKLNNVALAPGV